jgi:hypothetical protein
MFKAASGEQRMGKAYFLGVLQVQKQCDLCEDIECLEHPSTDNKDESVDGVKEVGVKNGRITIH